MKPTISIYLDKRREISTGEDTGRYHIKIMFTHYINGVRKRYYFKTDIFADEKEYAALINFGKIPRDKGLEKKQSCLWKLKEKADDILSREQFISPDNFGSKFSEEGAYRDVLGLLQVNAKELRAEGRIGNAITFEQSRSSLLKYNKEQPLSFAEITPKWLKRYEKDCTDNGLSMTTIGIYLRPLRAVFNQERGKTIPNDMYPFRENASQKGKYKIPTGKGRKLALNEEQKNKLLTFLSKNDDVQRAVDMWVFSYFCYGMNFADVARLRNKDIEKDVIVFNRKKTALTQRVKEDIEIPVRKEVKKIIARWGRKSLNPDDYVFTVLEKGLTEAQVKDRIRDFIKETNENLATACKSLKIPEVTTYWARHTFATIALRKGAGIEFIQDALGHTDPKTTRAYLDGFDFETKKAISDKL